MILRPTPRLPVTLLPIAGESARDLFIALRSERVGLYET